MMICKYLVWSVCLFFVAGIMLSSHGDILCLGDDGRVKIESICRPCCNDSNTTSWFKQNIPHHDHPNQCENCTDLPLLQHSLARRYLSPVFTPEICVNYLYVTLQASHIIEINSSNNHPLLEINSARRANILLSTTVLRC